MIGAEIIIDYYFCVANNFSGITADTDLPVCTTSTRKFRPLQISVSSLNRVTRNGVSFPYANLDFKDLLDLVSISSDRNAYRGNNLVSAPFFLSFGIYSTTAKL